MNTNEQELLTFLPFSIDSHSPRSFEASKPPIIGLVYDGQALELNVYDTDYLYVGTAKDENNDNTPIIINGVSYILNLYAEPRDHPGKGYWRVTFQRLNRHGLGGKTTTDAARSYVWALCSRIEHLLNNEMPPEFMTLAAAAGAVSKISRAEAKIRELADELGEQVNIVQDNKKLRGDWGKVWFDVVSKKA